MSCFLAIQLDAAELVLIESEQPLVAQIVDGLIQAGFHIAGHRKDARIAIQHGVGAAIVSGRIVADKQLTGLALIAGDIDF